MANQPVPPRGPQQRIPQRYPQQPVRINPRNYLRPGPKAKIIDLNKAMSSWGSNQAKYKEGDEFISKKILQNLEKTEDFAGIISQDKFKKNLKVINDIMSAGKGEISYKFKDTEIVLAEDVLNQNYVHHYKDNVWQYYREKNKNIIEKKEKQ